jgi:small subunit ribosomal protein S10e
MTKHLTLSDIPDLHCFLVMRSLKSRKFVTEVFSWQWHYYFLKNEGVKFLREYLGLPQTVIPNTHKVDRSTKREDEEGAEGEGETEGREGREERGFRGRGTRGTRGRGGRGRRDEQEQQV